MASVVFSRYFGTVPRCLPVLLLFVTDRCNLRCRMCGVCERELRDGRSNELTTEQWCGVIASAADKLGTFMISISGGEALLRPDLFEIISAATDRGLGVHLCTNGSLLTDDKVDALRDTGVSLVSVSIDGPDSATHDFLRGNGSFEGALRGLRLLRTRAPEIVVGINFLMAPHNYKSVPAMVAFAEQEGVKQLKFAPLHTNLLHRFKAPEDFEDLVFKPELLPEVERVLDETRRACLQQKLFTISRSFLKGIPQFYQGRQSFRCYAGYAVAAIGPSGELMPCCDIETGLSIKDRSLEEIWRDPMFQKARKRVRHCQAACWDTTNTELSLRLRPQSIAATLFPTLREMSLYFRSKS
jgi:MoaA/NifB/PqqE/SkfB family radical SAM enzyme